MSSTPITRSQQARLSNWMRLKHLPPLGYQLDPTRTRFIFDPCVAPLLRRAWKKVIEGIPPYLALDYLNQDLGFRSPMRGRTGGKPLARGAFYRMLHEPFYCGRLRCAFGTVAGEHPPLVNEEEFRRIQELLGGRGRRPIRVLDTVSQERFCNSDFYELESRESRPRCNAPNQGDSCSRC